MVMLKLNLKQKNQLYSVRFVTHKGVSDESKHYYQTWSDGVSDEVTSFYFGPPLDPEGFKNYKIYKK